jgi:hypothetical protein
MEQQLATGLGEGKVAELAEHDEVLPAKIFGQSPLPSGARFSLELVSQIEDVEEPAACAAANAGTSNRNREMGLPGTGSAEQYQIALVHQNIAAGEIAHQRFVDRRVVEAELCEVLGQRQFGNGLRGIDPEVGDHDCAWRR